MIESFNAEVNTFLSLSAQEQLIEVKKLTIEITQRIDQKEKNFDAIVSLIKKYKVFLTFIGKLRRIYRKEFFDFICESLYLLWRVLERCTSQRILYPTLSAFALLYTNLKGLSPYYTLTGCIDKKQKYSSFPSKEELSELLKKEREILTFLINYFQLESVLHFVKSEQEELTIIRFATNYAQLIILAIYNFLVTIPSIPNNEFVEWLELSETAIKKALESHHILLDHDLEEKNKFQAILSLTSLRSIRTQMLLLRVKFLNEDWHSLFTSAIMEISEALDDLNPFLSSIKYETEAKTYFYQFKTLLLETRFYQILANFVDTQFKKNQYIGDIKDDKKSLTLNNYKYQIAEILNEIENFIEKLQKEENTNNHVGISSNIINIYCKIAFGAYIYDLIDNTNKMEELIKIRRIDVADPELSLLLGHYWLAKWAKEDNNKYLSRAESYFIRAAELYGILFNNKSLPIYAYSIAGIISLRLNNPPKASVFFMKADDEFNDTKAMDILNQSEIYFYVKFREQIDKLMQNMTIDKPLRFEKPFNPLDFNSWENENKNWRKKFVFVPEPYPFHLSQVKILEFEFIRLPES